MEEIREWPWDIYNRTRLGRYLTSRELSFIRKILSKTASIKSILEVGCGSGKLARLLDTDGYKIVGLDHAELPLLWSKRNNNNITNVRGDAQDLPFKDDSFDCTIAIQMIDYLQQRRKFYEEVRRILRPGGIFILHFSNRRK